MHAVPESVRAKLKKPLGELLSTERLISKYGKMKLIAVGDIVLLSLLERGIKPFIAVYDFRSMRSELEKREQGIIRGEYPGPLVAKNPAGTITLELESAVREALKEGRAIFVDGEEDLAALVFMRDAPDGFAIIYGQPGEGAVAVLSGEKTRKKALALFAEMESQPEPFPMK